MSQQETFSVLLCGSISPAKEYFFIGGISHGAATINIIVNQDSIDCEMLMKSILI